MPSIVEPDGVLVDLATRHGLIGSLATATADPVVRAIGARNQARQRVMGQHLDRILTSLDVSGIPTAVVKGPAVSARYRDPLLRPFSDLDLLVRASDVERALAVLERDEAVPNIPPKRPKADKRDVTLIDRSGARFNVDLHWDLFDYSQFRGSASGAVEAAWDEATRVTDSSLGPRWDLPEWATWTFLAAHAMLDHRFRLILFRDLLELAGDGDTDWGTLARQAERWGLRSTTYLSCWLAAQLLGAAIPASFLDEVRPDSSVVRYLERSLPRLDVVRFDGHSVHPVNLAAVLLNDSPRQRFALAARAPVAFPAWRRRVGAEFDAGHGSPRHPRVLVVASTDRRRGAEVVSERLRDGLAARGWPIEAVSLTRSGDATTAAIEPLTELGPGEAGRFSREILVVLRRKVREFRPDVILANGGATLRYGVAAAVGSGAKVAYVGIGEPEYWFRSGWSRRANRALLRRTHRVFAVSETTRRQLVELEPRLETISAVAYTPIPDVWFTLPRADHTGPLRVVMVGSLSAEKDPLLGLRSVARSGDALLRLVGSGPLADDLRSEALALGMGDRLEMVGQVDDVTPHLAWADVLLLTSTTEGLPGAVIEAAAAGVAVITVDVGGVAEVVVDGESGFVVGERTTEAIGGALAILENDRDRCVEMGARGREHVRSRFSLGQVLTQYEALFEEAAHGPRR